MKTKGLPLVIMIRACPIPWALGNALFAVRRASDQSAIEIDGQSIESVKFWQFMIANVYVYFHALLLPCVRAHLVPPHGSRAHTVESSNPVSSSPCS